MLTNIRLFSHRSYNFSSSDKMSHTSQMRAIRSTSGPSKKSSDDSDDGNQPMGYSLDVDRYGNMLIEYYTGHIELNGKKPTNLDPRDHKFTLFDNLPMMRTLNDWNNHRRKEKDEEEIESPPKKKRPKVSKKANDDDSDDGSVRSFDSVEKTDFIRGILYNYDDDKIGDDYILHEEQLIEYALLLKEYLSYMRDNNFSFDDFLRKLEHFEPQKFDRRPFLISGGKRTDFS